jgi:hypothetical protein
MGGGATGGQPLKPDTLAFDMDAMAAACAASSCDARLPDFSLDKPEVWFSMVEACFEDCNITNEKQRYNKVLYRLPEAAVESLAALVSNIGNFPGREY